MINKFFFGISFLLSVNFFVQSAKAAEDKDIDYGLIRYTKGDVFLALKGEKDKKIAKARDKFFDGSEITTGINSFAILKLPDGSTLKLDPETDLKVEGLIQKKGDGYKGSSYLILSIGGVMVDVVKKFSGPPSLEIETVNQMAFGVRGTTFYIFHDKESGDVWGTVRQGQVMAMDYAKDDSEAIDAGMSMAVVEGQVLTKPHKYHWSEKLKWSFTEKEGELDTKRTASAEDRFKELQSLYQKLRNRTKKEFVKEKKAKQKSSGEGYRTPTGEYESHDASLFNTQGGGAGFSPMESEGENSNASPGYEGHAAGSNGGTGDSVSPEVLPVPTITPAPTMSPSPLPTVIPTAAPTFTPIPSPTPASIPEDVVTGGDAAAACKLIDPGAIPLSSCPAGSYPFGQAFGVHKEPLVCCVSIPVDGNAIHNAGAMGPGATTLAP